MGADPPKPDFVAGFAARHDNAAHLLARAFAPPDGLRRVRPAHPRRADRAGASFSPQPAAAGPKHFSPADPASNPTAGWNPLDAAKTDIDPIETARAAGYAAGLAAAREGRARDADLIAELVHARSSAGGACRPRDGSPSNCAGPC